MLGRTAGSRNARFVLFPNKFQNEKLTFGTNIGLGSYVPRRLGSEWNDPDPPRNIVYKLFLSRQVQSFQVPRLLFSKPCWPAILCHERHPRSRYTRTASAPAPRPGIQVLGIVLAGGALYAYRHRTVAPIPPGENLEGLEFGLKRLEQNTEAIAALRKAVRCNPELG